MIQKFQHGLIEDFWLFHIDHMAAAGNGLAFCTFDLFLQQRCSLMEAKQVILTDNDQGGCLDF